MPKLVSQEDLLEHWEGHRRLTRRTVEAFPAEQAFSFRPAAPMPSFGEMMLEVVEVVEPNLRGFLSGEWVWRDAYPPVGSKEGLLEAWDETSAVLQDDWPSIRADRLLAVEPGHFYGGPPEPKTKSTTAPRATSICTCWALQRIAQCLVPTGGL